VENTTTMGYNARKTNKHTNSTEKEAPNSSSDGEIVTNE
jgi:hypothetical protein